MDSGEEDRLGVEGYGRRLTRRQFMAFAAASGAATVAVGVIGSSGAQAVTYTCIPVGYYDDGVHWWLIWGYFIIPRRTPCGIVYELVGPSC